MSVADDEGPELPDEAPREGDAPREELASHADDTSHAEDTARSDEASVAQENPGTDAPTRPPAGQHAASGADAAAPSTPAPGAGAHVAEHARPAASGRNAWLTLARAGAPRATRTQVVAALLCGLLGFGIVVQVSSTREKPLTGLRQNELVRILDETTRRGNELARQAASLREQLGDLESGNADQEALLALAQERATVQGILSGRLPAEGPGVAIRVSAGAEPLRATVYRAILEELRNAGAEVVQVGDVRIVASSSFIDTAQGVSLDGTVLTSPVEWRVIGAADTIVPALEIPGGAMAQVRNAGATGEVTTRDKVEVTAVREAPATQWAVPVPVEPAD